MSEEEMIKFLEQLKDMKPKKTLDKLIQGLGLLAAENRQKLIEHKYIYEALAQIVVKLAKEHGYDTELPYIA